jgi:cytochrome c oxidase subunit II
MTRVQSALDSAGAHASRIEGLWWIFFWVSVVVYVLVIGALLVALVRKRGEGSETTATRVVTGAVAVTVITLFVLLVSSITVGRSLAGIPPSAVTIEVTAHQWWWQVDYDHVQKNRRFTTANEIYIPVGEPVHVKLRTSDVIHSFWVPNLHGKHDMITGHEGGIVLQADRRGTWRGQCAEFCGLQHAKMAFWVTALPKAEYERWAESQRQPSRIPSTPSQRKGQEAFMNAPCPLCHTVAGTDASGKVAPDLTHFASRRSIAAAVVPNRRGYLAAWIVDPQHLKPGSNMPPMALSGTDLNALLDYLESLE